MQGSFLFFPQGLSYNKINLHPGCHAFTGEDRQFFSTMFTDKDHFTHELDTCLMNPTAIILSWCVLISCFSTLTVLGDGPNDHFFNLSRAPDWVSVVTEVDTRELATTDDAVWGSGGIEVMTKVDRTGVQVELAAPEHAVKYLKLRWNGSLPTGEWRYLGDAWERAYGNLQWLSLEKTREMPWYFLASKKTITHGYGVMTAPAAFCSWTADAAGATLTLDVRDGGLGVQLGDRRLTVCTVVCRRGKEAETAFAAAHAFCGMMCPKPRLPKQPVYGFNDWYCDYGKNSTESVRGYTDFVVRLAAKGNNRPFMVIDDGWQPGGGNGGGGPWDRSGPNFPSMAETAAEIKKAGARPGIWIRLMSIHKDIPNSWRIENKTRGLDISKPEVRAYVKESVARLRGWGYELIKHDYSTFDITNGWGSARPLNRTTFGPSPIVPVPLPKSSSIITAAFAKLRATIAC